MPAIENGVLFNEINLPYIEVLTRNPNIEIQSVEWNACTANELAGMCFPVHYVRPARLRQPAVDEAG